MKVIFQREPDNFELEEATYGYGYMWRLAIEGLLSDSDGISNENSIAQAYFEIISLMNELHFWWCNLPFSIQKKTNRMCQILIWFLNETELLLRPILYDLQRKCAEFEMYI